MHLQMLSGGLIPGTVKALVKAVVTGLALTLAASAAQADCYADYKAKKDNPLRLHYGVIQLPQAACRDRARARKVIAARIGVGGWRLLNVMSVFGPEGLASRKDSAGQFYLRF